MTFQKQADIGLDDQLDAYRKRASRPAGKKSAVEILGYTAAAGGLAFAGGDAVAGIVHHTAASTFAFNGASTGAVIRIDLDGIGGDDLFMAARIEAGARINVGIISSSYYPSYADALTTGGGGIGSAMNLAPGFVIGPTLASGAFNLFSDRIFRSNTIEGSVGQFINGSTGYLGLRFAGDSGVIGTQYAWAKIRIDADLQNDTLQVSFLEWAYNDCGDSIQVGATSGSCGSDGGAVPEPATAALALLGLGAMGVQGFRRRRDAGLKRLAEEKTAA